MDDRKKRLGLMLLGGSLLALLLLAAGIANVEFREGVPFSLADAVMAYFSAMEPTSGGKVMTIIMRVILILLWVMVPVLLIVLILDKEARREFLRNLVSFIPLILLIFAFSQLRKMSPAEESSQPQPVQITAEDLGQQLPGLTFTPDPPRWLVLLLSVLAAVVILLLIAGVVLVIRRRLEEARRGDATLEQIAGEAEYAVQSLRRGGDLKDVVLRCYAEMNRMVSETRGLVRGRSVTPHEFESALVELGLPPEPVQRLTRLFEDVRYGGFAPGETEKQAAIESLEKVVEVCRPT